MTTTTLAPGHTSVEPSSWRTWWRHRGHTLSGGQVLCRILVAQTLWLCASLGSSVTFESLQTTWSARGHLDWNAAPLSTRISAIAAILAITAIPIAAWAGALRMWLGVGAVWSHSARNWMTSYRRRLADAVESVPDDGPEPGEAATTLFMLTAVFSGIGLAAFSTARALLSLPLNPATPALCVTAVAAVAWASLIFLDGFLDPQQIGTAVRTALPAVKGRLNLPAPVARCPICDGLQRPRPLPRRLAQALHRRAQLAATRAGRHSRIADYASHHPDLALGIPALAALLWVADSQHSTAVEVLTVVAYGSSLCVLMFAMTGGGSNVFDAMRNPPAHIATMSLGALITFGLMGSVQLIEWCATVAQRADRFLPGGYDEGSAVLFFLALEVSLVYGMANELWAQIGTDFIWPRREVVNYATGLLGSLLMSALDFDWSLTLVVLLLSWLTLHFRRQLPGSGAGAQ